MLTDLIQALDSLVWWQVILFFVAVAVLTKLFVRKVSK
jgi:hypothetical protein